MHARVRVLVFSLATLTLGAAPAVAQQTAATPAASAAGPRLELTATAAHRLRTANAATASLARRQSMGKPVALMVVGGIALVVGLVIGGSVGTLFAIGGAVIGLIGLYQYLQ